MQRTLLRAIFALWFPLTLWHVLWIPLNSLAPTLIPPSLLDKSCLSSALCLAVGLYLFASVAGGSLMMMIQIGIDLWMKQNFLRNHVIGFFFLSLLFVLPYVFELSSLLSLDIQAVLGLESLPCLGPEVGQSLVAHSHKLWDITLPLNLAGRNMFVCCRFCCFVAVLVSQSYQWDPS